MSPADAFKAGTAAFQAGAFETALAHLQGLRHPQALNLAAVSAQRLGQADAAAALFRQATGLAPHDPNTANNFGHFELAQGRLAEARACFDTALAHAPDLLAAHIGRAKIHAAEDNWPAAAAAWQAVLTRAPASRVGRYGWATALLETGQAEQAVTAFEALLADGETPELHFMLGRAHQELNALDRAEACFRAAYTQRPDRDSLRNLANLYWMQGDRARFDALVAEAPAGLRTVAVRLMVDSGALEAAGAAWAHAFGTQGEAADGEAWTLKALMAREAGQGDAVAAAADRALALSPSDAAAQDMRIVADLMQGRGEAALRRLVPLREAAPEAQHWLAHESVAHRLLEKASPLLDVDHYVRAYDLAPPPGYASLEAFNAALGQKLHALHPFSARPLNQSLRGNGTQTTRNLLDHEDEVVRAYCAALDAPIRSYLEEIGQDPAHPTGARNQGSYRFSGMWSVRLTGQGYHEPHIHPAGWISSAYYVQVPDGTDTAPDRAGWIGFGVPPYRTPKALPPLKEIAPRPGRLVLFPSFMWHGTRPIAAGAERMTAPFDLLPG